MDARNSQFLQRTATNSSGSLQLKSPVSLEAGDFGLYIWRCLVWRCLSWRCLSWWVSCDCLGTAWSSERLAFALAPVCLAELWREFAPVGCLGSALRLPWRRLVWRVSCACLGAAWSSECLALALAPVCLAELWREFAPVGVCSASACLGVACRGGCPAFALALLGLASALRLPWYLSAWRSCGVLACDSDLVRQGRGLPYKTGSVKDWFGKTRFSRTNWIRRRISLAQ